MNWIVCKCESVKIILDLNVVYVIITFFYSSHLYLLYEPKCIYSYFELYVYLLHFSIFKLSYIC